MELTISNFLNKCVSKERYLQIASMLYFNDKDVDGSNNGKKIQNAVMADS
jgi:hypothetical protein